MMFMGGTFPWPLLLVPVIFGVAMFVFMASRMRRGGGSIGPGSGMGRASDSRAAPAQIPMLEDPLVTLRVRYVHGEIDTEEFERRLDGLLNSDPGQKMPWLKQ